MRRILISIVAVSISILASCAGSKGNAERTSGARAAYGVSAPFKSHMKKNKKSKNKAEKAAKRKKQLKTEPYRRLPM
jgi:hypothetical protein